MIDVMVKYLKTGAPTEELNTEYGKIATVPTLKTPQITAIKVIEAILYDIQLSHSKLKFFKENGEYKAIIGSTKVSYFIITQDDDLEFAHEVWNQTLSSLP